ncbi:MAG: TrmH family RNA methyltransferase [Bdellovibrionales bacterium]
MNKIESAQNAHFKKLLSLTSAKGLKAEGLFLLGGEKLVREFLQKPHLTIAYEIVPAGGKPLTRSDGIKIIELAENLFAEIDVLGTHYNILAVEQPTIGKLADAKTHRPKGIEVVIPIGDPGNLGALIRSCEAFSVPRVILAREAAHPFLPKAVKASAGSVLRVPMLRGPALADFPASSIALDMGGQSIYKFKWPKDGMLIVGEEGSGLGRAKFTQRVTIPTQGVESLNAVVAASIALAHMATLT